MDQALRDQWLAQADETLSSNGRRAGAARTAIVELFAREGQCPLGAHDILERLPNGSPASVYRTLEELHRLGLLSRFNGHDGIARYEIAHPHHRSPLHRRGDREPDTVYGRGPGARDHRRRAPTQRHPERPRCRDPWATSNKCD